MPGNSSTLPQETAASRERTSRPWWVLAVLCVSQLMIVLDTTIINIALPSAQRDLGFSDALRQWVVTAYALAFGALLLLGGRLADLIGRRRSLAIGLAGFGAVSALAGAAPDIGWLIAARAVQGVFAALLAPAALSLLSAAFAGSDRRGTAYGVFGAVGGSGAAVGLLLGGSLTQYLDWRWTLYVNVAIAAVALAGTFAVVPRDERGSRPSVDVPGAVLIGAGLFAVVFGAARAETDGWSDAVTVAALAAGVVLVAVFVAVERRVAHPLLPLRVVLERRRAGALVALLMSAAGMFAVFLFVTYYLQDTLGYSAIGSGVAFLPLAGTVVVGAAVSGRVLSERIPARVLLPAGLLLGAVALVVLTRLDAGSQYATDLLPAFVVFGAGLGVVFGVAIDLGTVDVRDDDAGAASGLVNVMQQVGGSIGVAVLSTLAASAAGEYVSDNLRSAPSSAAGRAVLGEATLRSYETAYWWGAAIFVLGAVATAVLLPRRSGR
ncbi:MFS transporter [Jatrophihabitans fulvus]